MRIAPAIALSSDQQATLEQWARSRSLAARVVERARIVLLAAEGRQDKQIAAAMKITPKKVSGWRSRFLTLGMAGLERDASRPGRAPKITASWARRVVRMTTQQKRRMALTGARAAWPERCSSARPACVGSGAATA
jgi:FixJ family two-component response regulator